MTEQLLVLEEPLLEFRYGQFLEAPYDGLSIFGPYGIEVGVHPKNITYGLIGSREGIDQFQSWCRGVQLPVYPPSDLDPHLWPLFPGFEAAFQCSLPTEPAWVSELDGQEIVTACHEKDPNKRASAVVELYLSRIALTERRDEPFGLLVCVVPDVVWQACRPLSYVSEGTGARISTTERDRRAAGQLDFFDSYDPEIYCYSVDFRRQIKARAMHYKVPIQIVRQSTFNLAAPAPRSSLSPPSDVAWNLLTTVYYKAGGKPWRLAAARPGVCYIGIAFRRTGHAADSRTACCAAQMFLDSGDGVVFLGQYGPWYSPEHKQFHLSPEAAKQLLGGVLATYNELEGQELTEIFLHCRSGILPEEFAGYQAATPPRVKLVGIRVRKDRDAPRFYREGTRPVLRGCFWPATQRLGYLCSSGFIPRLRTYPGWETPVPLSIEVQRGDADIVQVARDILALTKLNYNACRFCDSEPVTIGFSNSVGEILVSNPTVADRSPKFKFYI